MTKNIAKNRQETAVAKFWAPDANFAREQQFRQQWIHTAYSLSKDM